MLPLFKSYLEESKVAVYWSGSGQNEHHDNRFQQLQTMLQAKSKSNRKKYFFNQTDD